MGACSTNGRRRRKKKMKKKKKKKNASRLLVGKPEGKKSLGRRRRSEWMILSWILER
jgi:hypothetical protein